MICRDTMRECPTPSMCAPFGGCAGSVDTDRIAFWAGVFISTGNELGITKNQMLKALTPTKLAAIFDVVAAPDTPAQNKPEQDSVTGEHSK